MREIIIKASKRLSNEFTLNGVNEAAHAVRLLDTFDTFKSPKLLGGQVSLRTGTFGAGIGSVLCLDNVRLIDD